MFIWCARAGKLKENHNLKRDINWKLEVQKLTSLTCIEREKTIA